MRFSVEKKEKKEEKEEKIHKKARKQIRFKEENKNKIKIGLKMASQKMQGKKVE